MILENNYLSVKILPELGGKVASVFYKPASFELAAQSPDGNYRVPQEAWNPSFEKYDASGIDDAFPNIDTAVLEYDGRQLEYPDHGEIWSSAFAVCEQEGAKVRLAFDSERFGYHYEKTLELVGDELVLQYHIVNISDRKFPCIWTFHGLMRYEEDMKLILPEDIEEFRNVSDSDLLGKAGVLYKKDNPVWDFSKVPAKEPQTAMKFYSAGKSTGGRCSLEYPSQDVRCQITYDADKLPWFGVWITAGGFRGDYNLAMEPTNGYYDDVLRAQENDSLCVLEPNEALDFTVRIKMEKISYANMKVYNVLEEPFKIYGLYEPHMLGKFQRMPTETAMSVDNSEIQFHYTNTSGGRIRFCTDSDHIIIRAVMPFNSMTHMPDTGSSCFDLYLDGEYFNVFRPGINLSGGYEDTGRLDDGYQCGYRLDGRKMREVLIHFPLYSNVEQVFIALNEDAKVLPSKEYACEKPIVYYGSSITQGGCASHAGNSYQAIIARSLDVNYVNLGFSGGCRAEEIMAEYISDLDMSVFVYDYDHNAESAEYLEKTHEPLFRKIREKQPDLPVVIISAADRVCGFDEKRRGIIRRTYENAVTAGDKNVYFLDGSRFYQEVGVDLCTVDSVHPNDLGFWCMARAITPVLREILKNRNQ